MESTTLTYGEFEKQREEIYGRLEKALWIREYLTELKKFNTLVAECVKEGEKRLSYERIKELEGLVKNTKVKELLLERIEEKKKATQEFFQAFCSQMDNNNFLVNAVKMLCNQCINSRKCDVSIIEELMGTVHPELLKHEILNEMTVIVEGTDPPEVQIEDVDESDSVSSFSKSSDDEAEAADVTNA